MSDAGFTFLGEDQFKEIFGRNVLEPTKDDELTVIASERNGMLSYKGDHRVLDLITADNTSKVNYDNLLDIVDAIKVNLNDHVIIDYSAEHDCQQIVFCKAGL